MAKFTSLNKDEMVKLVYRMVSVNENKAWSNFWECDGVKHYCYDFSRVKKIFDMVSDWNCSHDYEEEILIDRDTEEVENFEEVVGAEGYTGIVIRVYLEEDQFVFPEA